MDSDVKLQFLGSGSFFTPMTENFQSNMILHSDSGKNLLIDCGTDARHSMAALGYTAPDIDSVYISHLHADHAGGLEWLAFCARFSHNGPRPKLYIHPLLKQRLWNNVLSGGMQSLAGDRPAELSDFYEPMPLDDVQSFIWEDIQFHLIETVHIFNGPEKAPSYGLYFSTPKKRVFITTDTCFDPIRYQSWYEQADIIFHDCDTGKHKSAVHAHFTELSTLPREIKAKMWLYHYSSAKHYDAKVHGFKGFVVKGQQFEF